MKILLTGVNGQVGYELLRSLQGLGEIVAVDRNRMDLSNLDQVREVVRTIQPQLIINPAAYTAVDKAESESELAMTINGRAPGVLAEEAARIGAAMIHYSTDYVFDGRESIGYTEADETNPVNVYGATKLEGERAVAAAGIPHLILRTSWVYGARGKNFLLTMCRLAQERSELRVVADQHGAPTWCGTIASATADLVSKSLKERDHMAWWKEKSGIYHLASQGKTTWHGFASAIVERMALEKKPAVLPITTDEYPTPARRPQYSVLSSDRFMNEFGPLPPWDAVLNRVMQSL